MSFFLLPVETGAATATGSSSPGSSENLDKTKYFLLIKIISHKNLLYPLSQTQRHITIYSIIFYRNKKSSGKCISVSVQIFFILNKNLN